MSLSLIVFLLLAVIETIEENDSNESLSPYTQVPVSLPSPTRPSTMFNSFHTEVEPPPPPPITVPYVEPDHSKRADFDDGYKASTPVCVDARDVDDTHLSTPSLVDFFDADVDNDSIAANCKDTYNSDSDDVNVVKGTSAGW